MAKVIKIILSILLALFILAYIYLSKDMSKEWIATIPSILWFIFVLVLFILFYKPIRDELLPRLGSIKAAGVEFSFVENSINAAIEFGEKSEKWDVKVPEKDKKAALNRAKHHLDTFRNTKILWVDDYPENNRNERRMLRQLKADIDIAKNSDEALEMLRCDIYDLVISDIARDDKDDLYGLQFLSELRKTDPDTPVIFYIGVMEAGKGVPEHAFGITNRPDELLHLTLDALERNRY
jgi:CheY-like chemotaxis protein